MWCRCSAAVSIANSRGPWDRRRWWWWPWWGAGFIGWAKETSESCWTTYYWSLRHWRLEQYASASCYCNRNLHSTSFLPVQIVAACSVRSNFCLFLCDLMTGHALRLQWCVDVHLIVLMWCFCHRCRLMPILLNLCFCRLLMITV